MKFLNSTKVAGFCVASPLPGDVASRAAIALTHAESKADVSGQSWAPGCLLAWLATVHGDEEWVFVAKI